MAGFILTSLAGRLALAKKKNILTRAAPRLLNGEGPLQKWWWRNGRNSLPADRPTNPMFDLLFSKRGRILQTAMRLSPKVLVCLTYPSIYPELPIALDQLRRLVNQLKKDGNRGLWFLAYQARGAPFYWLLLSRYVEKEVLSSSWYHI